MERWGARVARGAVRVWRMGFGEYKVELTVVVDLDSVDCCQSEANLQS